jgi:glycine C-acetyltransferase
MIAAEGFDPKGQTRWIPPISLTCARRSIGYARTGSTRAKRTIRSPQSPAIELASGSRVINFCANNYLGLADDARLIAAAKDGLDRYGFGMASVRFICGTQTEHKALEAALAAFLRTDDSILYGSCFDANGGLFETLLGEEDAVVSDELNHASIVDGIRLCKAKRYRYRNNDMADLAAKLAEAERGGRALQADRDRWRVLDGRHPRRPPVDLRSRRQASRADDGRRFARGRLRRSRADAEPRSTAASKADRHRHRNAGQGAGRRVGRLYCGRKEIIELLRQRSRPYLFSNSLAPASPRHRCACSSFCKATKGAGSRGASRRTASGSAAR